MKSLAERISGDDALGVGRLARRISGALLSGSYRYDSSEWEGSDEDSGNVPDRLPFDSSGGTHRPYFETLIVSPAPAANFAKIAQEIRRLRRVEDPMIYEPVLVGSFEDAIVATIMNGKIEAVVIYDGIPVPSQHDVPLVRDFLASLSSARYVEPCATRGRRDAGTDDQAHPPRARHLSADRPAGREDGGRPCGLDDPTRVLRSRGADRGASEHPRRRRRSLGHAALRQPRSATPRGRSAPSTRCRSRAASRS